MSSESHFYLCVKLIFSIRRSVRVANIVHDPKVYNPNIRYTWDFTGYNVPFGMALIAVGLCFMWSALFKSPRIPGLGVSKSARNAN